MVCLSEGKHPHNQLKQMTSELTLDQLTKITGGDAWNDKMSAREKKHVKHRIEGLTLEEALAGKDDPERSCF